MKAMENVKPLTDYDLFQTPAEMRNNVKLQVLRDAALVMDPADTEELREVLATRPYNISSQTHFANHALFLVNGISPKAAEIIRQRLAEYEEYEKSNIQNGTTPAIRKIFPGDGYFKSAYLEDDSDYSPDDPVAEVVYMDEYLERSIYPESYPESRT